MAIRVLITGSNGLLGQKMVSLLHGNDKYEIVATARGDDRLPKGKYNYTYRSLDVTNQEEVYGLMAEIKPDFVVHTAAMTNVDECEAERDLCWVLNVRTVEYLVEACRKNNAHLIHLSTDFIFNGEEGPYDEEAKPDPISFYGASKLAAERVVFKSGIDWTVLRTVLVYGIVHDMSRSNIVLWVKNSLENGKTISLVTDQWRTPTLAEDLALGCLLAIEHKAKGIYNISGKDFLTPYEMAILTANYFGLDKSLIVTTTTSLLKQTAQRPAKTGFIIDKAINELGYKPHSFEEGIKIVVEQMNEKTITDKI